MKTPAMEVGLLNTPVVEAAAADIMCAREAAEVTVSNAAVVVAAPGQDTERLLAGAGRDMESPHRLAGEQAAGGYSQAHHGVGDPGAGGHSDAHHEQSGVRGHCEAHWEVSGVRGWCRGPRCTIGRTLYTPGTRLQGQGPGQEDIVHSGTGQENAECERTCQVSH